MSRFPLRATTARSPHKVHREIMTKFKCPYCPAEYELTVAHLSFQQRSYANCQVWQTNHVQLEFSKRAPLRSHESIQRCRQVQTAVTSCAVSRLPAISGEVISGELRTPRRFPLRRFGAGPSFQTQSANRRSSTVSNSIQTCSHIELPVPFAGTRELGG
jgi:hypothetical protein